MIFQTNKYVYYFRKFQTKRQFGDSIFNGKNTTNEANKNHNILLEFILQFNDKARSRLKVDKEKKRSTYESVNTLYKGSECTLNAFKSVTFPLKTLQGKRLKVLSPKQTFQRLPIRLAQVKAGNTSENLLNEIFQIINSLHQAKEITKKVYNNIMNSIKL